MILVHLTGAVGKSWYMYGDKNGKRRCLKRGEKPKKKSCTGRQRWRPNFLPSKVHQPQQKGKMRGNA